MSNQRRQRRPFLSIGMLMRRFSRSLAQRYLGDEPLPEVEAEESDEPVEFTPSRPVARPVAKPQTAEDAIRAAERITSKPAPRPAAPKPAPPKPAPAPIQRAPDPAPAAPSTPSAPISAAPAPSEPAKPAGVEWPEGVPRTWNGTPIPVNNTPTPPALKAWIQRERERENRRKEILEERKDQLLSKLPPPPEDPNAPRGRRLLPRGHSGVDYVNTDSLRGDEPPAPVQRKFDLQKDEDAAPPTSPREPSSPHGERAAEDDDTPHLVDPSFTPDEGGIDNVGVVGATPDQIQAAIQRAEAPSETSESLSPTLQQGVRGKSGVSETRDAPEQVQNAIQRAAEVSPTPPAAPMPLDIPDPASFAAPLDDEGGDIDDVFWDADDAPDLGSDDDAGETPQTVTRPTPNQIEAAIQRAEAPDTTPHPLSPPLPQGARGMDDVNPSPAQIQAAIQRAESPTTPEEPPSLLVREAAEGWEGGKGDGGTVSTPATPDQIQAAIQRAESPTVPETPPSPRLRAEPPKAGRRGQGDEGAVTPSPAMSDQIEAAIQRAEAPVETPHPLSPPLPQGARGMDDMSETRATPDQVQAAIQRAEFSSALEEPSSPLVREAAEGWEGDKGDEGTVATPATPDQVQAAIQRAESPAAPGETPHPLSPPRPLRERGMDAASPSSATATSDQIEAAIQRAESPSALEEPPSPLVREAAEGWERGKGDGGTVATPVTADQIQAAIQRAEAPSETPYPLSPPLSLRRLRAQEDGGMDDIRPSPATPDQIQAAIQRAEAPGETPHPLSPPLPQGARGMNDVNLSPATPEQVQAAVQRAEAPGETPHPLSPPLPQGARGMDDVAASSATADQIQAAIQRAESPTAPEALPSPRVRAEPPKAGRREPGDEGTVSNPAAPFIPTARPVGEVSISTAAPTPTAAVQAAIQRAESIPVVTRVPVAPAPARPRVTAQPVAAPLPTVQRAADPMPEPASQPAPERPDLFQAMVAAGMVAPPPGGMVQRTPDVTEAIRRAESLSPSSKPDLAQALGLISRASDANAQVQRAPDETPMLSMEGMPVEPSVQRVVEGSEVDDDASEKARGQAPNIDLDKLADDVYRSLEKRLRTAADRRPK